MLKSSRLVTLSCKAHHLRLKSADSSSGSPLQRNSTILNARSLLPSCRGSVRCLLTSPVASSKGEGAGGGKEDVSSYMPEAKQMSPSIASFSDLHRFSVQHPDVFWSVLARSRLEWMREFTQPCDVDLRSGRNKWFADGVLNVTVNAVDRHARKDPNKVALIWEKDEPKQAELVTYGQLQSLVNRISNTLKSSGVKKGDRVALYIPNTPVAVACMLACARIGAIHTVVFAGFSADALAGRIQDAGAETVITADQAVRGGRLIELKKTVDQAVEKCPTVKRVFVYERTGAKVSMGKKDISLLKSIESASAECEPEPMSSEDVLFMLYTSGSTGKPKGLVHSTAGYLLYAATAVRHVFDLREGDRFGCVADIGWVTGHTAVVYGPLCNGVTSLVFESTPVYPDAGRYWETADRLKLTQLYCAPTAIRLLLRHGDKFAKKYSRSSLRLLASVGEPINHPAWEWYHRVVGEGRCDVVDTWWQTETGAMCISPRPSAPGAVIKPAMPMRPMFGIDPVLLDVQGKELTGGDVTGALCIRTAWPGLARTIWGSHERFMDTYLKPFPGYYFSGDEAHRDEDGYYTITGRLDDVINVTGHRLGTAEVEEVLCEHPEVAEAAVVGFPHEVKGEGIFAFVVLKNVAVEGGSSSDGSNGDESEDLKLLKKELNALVKKRIAGYAVPEQIQVCVSGLPKTRSGKIMRRILRKIAANDLKQLGDISTLADPTVVQQIIDQRVKQTAK